MYPMPPTNDLSSIKAFFIKADHNKTPPGGWPENITWTEAKVKKLVNSNAQRRGQELMWLKERQVSGNKKTKEGFLIEQFEEIKKAQEEQKAQEVEKFKWIEYQKVWKQDGISIDEPRIAMFGSFTIDQTEKIIIILTDEKGQIQNFGIPGIANIPRNYKGSAQDEISKMVDEYERTQ